MGLTSGHIEAPRPGCRGKGELAKYQERYYGGNNYTVVEATNTAGAYFSQTFPGKPTDEQIRRDWETERWDVI